MIILTERLQAIADNIENGERVADIGTDHGYLPLYLKEKNITENPILADVSKGSLLKAEENCKRLFPGFNFDLRLGDGLDVVSHGEVDTVVMAGIGGLLTIEILDWDISKVYSFKKLILQPRNNMGALRRYLYEICIEPEKIVIVPEDRRYCEIMVCPIPDGFQGRRKSEGIDDTIFEFPDVLLNNRDNSTREYLKDRIRIEERIIENIIAGREETKETVLQDPAIKARQDMIDRVNYLLERME